jgi:hypothetical protein
MEEHTQAPIALAQTCDSVHVIFPFFVFVFVFVFVILLEVFYYEVVIKL